MHLCTHILDKTCLHGQWEEVARPLLIVFIATSRRRQVWGVNPMVSDAAGMIAVDRVQFV